MTKKWDVISIKELKARRNELLSELKRIDKVLKAVDTRPAKEVQWMHQAVECLKSWNEFLQSATILECMFYNQKHILEQPGKRRNYLVALSVALNKLCAKGVLVKAEYAGIRGHFYGLPEWTNNGLAEDLKPEYHEKLLKRLNEKRLLTA